MPPSPQFPTMRPTMRHFKARLKVLRRPQVWAAATLLLAAGYGLMQYWQGPYGSDSWSGSAVRNPVRQNPLLGTNRLDQGGSTGLGIPSLPNQSVQPLPKLEASPTAPEPATRRPNSNLAASDRSNRANLDRAESFDPLLTPGIPAGFSNPDTFSSVSPSSGASTAVSPLQSALDRNLSSGLTDSSPADPAPAQSLSPAFSSFASDQTSQFQPFVPRTSPPPGTTGYTLPPAFRTPTTSGSEAGFTHFSRPQPVPGVTSQQSNQPSIGYGQSRDAGGYLSPAPQIPQADSVPFSVPRTPLGRSIGGGQINTFSNP